MMFRFGQGSLIPDGWDLGKDLAAFRNSSSLRGLDAVSMGTENAIQKAAVVCLEGVRWEPLLVICVMRCDS
jgi:hypothetical protein